MPRRSPSALMFISASGRSSSASRRACVSDRNSGASTGAAALINWILPFILLILRLLDRARQRTWCSGLRNLCGPAPEPTDDAGQRVWVGGDGLLEESVEQQAAGA